MVRETTKTVLFVTGVVNNRDRERAVDALERVKGVVQVDVNLHRAEATVLHRPPCSTAELVRVLTEAGYHAIPAPR